MITTLCSALKIDIFKMGRVFALLCLGLILPLSVSCGIGGYKSVVYSKDKLATPPTTLSQRDYPFDEKGRYRTDWVKGGSNRKRSASSFRAASNSPSQNQSTSIQSPKISSNQKKSPTRMTLATNTTQTTKPKPPPVYTPKSKPPTPKPPAPAPAKKQASYHTIAKGDTLWGISKRYKVSISAIKSANGLTSDLIRPGQTLRLP